MDEQQQNEATWRQLLVQGVLAVLLPTEDLENGCLRALVSEVFSETIVGNAICRRACESWLLWEATIQIAETIQLQSRQGMTGRSGYGKTDAKEGPSRLEHFGLLSSREELLKPVESNARRGSSESVSVSAVFWAGIQYAFLAFTALRAILTMLVSSSSLPSRGSTSGEQAHPDDGTESGVGTANLPVLSMGVWRMLSHLIELEQRMPWLAGFLSLMHLGLVSGAGRLGGTDGALDR